MGWNYERNETKFTPLAAGKYRVRIAKAEKCKSSTGKDMLKIMFDVSGKNNKLFHNIVFLPDRPEITNRNLTQFFDAFPGIKDGDFNTANWTGKVGACKTKIEQYKGEDQAQIDYFIAGKDQGDLPAWVEPEKKESAGTAPAPGNPAEFMNVPEGVDEECPF